MKYIASFLVLASSMMLSMSGSVVQAVDINVTDPNNLSKLKQSQLIVTAVPLIGAEFIELHNQTDEAVNLEGYSVVFTFDLPEPDTKWSVSLPSDVYIVADGYITLGTSANGYVDLKYNLNEVYQNENLVAVAIEKNTDSVTQIENIVSQGSKTWLKRKSGASGDGTTQSHFTEKVSPAELSGYGLFVPPDSAPGVKIVEIYPRASDCRPGEDSVLCGDYVKLHNPTNHSIDLSEYQLRSDSGSSASGNRFELNYEMDPNSYVAVHVRTDGDKLSLTDSGGYVWIEDRAGIAPYNSTIVSYPSTPSTQIGWSWAQGKDGAWKWTSTPQPQGMNRFEVPLEEEKEPEDELTVCDKGKYRNPETNRCKTIEVTASLTPCRAGQERNPDTNRCRNAVLALASLVPCSAVQERNPATNRCRSITAATTNLVPCKAGQSRNPTTNRCRAATSAVSSLVPCKPGQTRNPETNRCKSTSTSASSLVPCKPGQQRNPETNRCRNSSSRTLAASSGAENANSEAHRTQPTSWYMLAGVVGVVAGGYGLWEWRSDIANATKRLLGGLKSS